MLPSHFRLTPLVVLASARRLDQPLLASPSVLTDIAGLANTQDVFLILSLKSHLQRIRARTFYRSESVLRLQQDAFGLGLMYNNKM